MHRRREQVRAGARRGRGGFRVILRGGRKLTSRLRGGAAYKGDGHALARRLLLPRGGPVSCTVPCLRRHETRYASGGESTLEDVRRGSNITPHEKHATRSRHQYVTRKQYLARWRTNNQRVSERPRYLRLEALAQGQGRMPRMRSSRAGAKAREAEPEAALFARLGRFLFRFACLGSCLAPSRQWPRGLPLSGGPEPEIPWALRNSLVCDLRSDVGLLLKRNRPCWGKALSVVSGNTVLVAATRHEGAKRSVLPQDVDASTPVVWNPTRVALTIFGSDGAVTAPTEENTTKNTTAP